MNDELWKLIGILVTILVAAGSAIIAAFRSVRKTMQADSDHLRERMQAGDDQLHERVNRVRDEYVRRIDLDSHMARIEGTLKEMRDEQRNFTREMLAMLNRHGDRQ